jgi:transcription antitermination protein NusB
MTHELSRNQSHEVAMSLIYAALTYTEIKLPVDVESLVEDYFEVSYDEADLFVKTVLIQSLKHYHLAISHLEPHMVNWKFARLNRVAQAILLLAYIHHHYVKDADKSVIIDVAVRLSKKFLHDDEYKFINAILDKVL